MKKLLYFDFCIYHRTSLFSTTLRLDSWLWRPLTELPDHTHWTHHIQYSSSRRAISPRHRPLPNNTQHTAS